MTGDPEPPKTSNANVVPKPSTGGGNAVATVTGKKDPVLCSALMQFICELVEGSTSIQQQVFTTFYQILGQHVSSQMSCLIEKLLECPRISPNPEKNPLLTDFCPSGDCWSRFPGDLPPAFQEQPRSPDGRPAQHLPQAHQVPRHLPNQQQVDDDDDDS